MISILLLFYLSIIGLFIAGYWKTFEKAGQPGWACLVPIYNYLVMADIARVSRAQVWKAIAVSIVGFTIGVLLMTTSQEFEGLVILGVIIQFATGFALLILMFPIYKGIALNFSQGAGFAWGLIFLNLIFFAILGFGSAKYLVNNSFLDNDILDAEI